ILFQRLLAQLWSRVPAAKAIVREDYWFLANGGAVQFERNPYLAFLPEAGLVEGATPECRGPRQLLCFQRAQDLLLSRAAASSDARQRLGTLTALGETAFAWLLFLGFLPHTVLGWLILRPLAFRRQRRQLLAFLISRPIIAGAGALHEDGSFTLSARAPAINA